MGSNSIDSGNSIFCNHVSPNVKESVYVDENDLSKSLSSYPLSHLQPLLVMHCNTISLTNRLNRLREFLKKFPVMPHLIAITETRLKTSSNLQSINLPQCTFCHAKDDIRLVLLSTKPRIPKLALWLQSVGYRRTNRCKIDQLFGIKYLLSVFCGNFYSRKK